MLDPKGLDPARLMAHKAGGKSLKSFPGKSITNKQLLELPVDILVPAALENQITANNASRIRAKLIAEAANGPTNPLADESLFKRGHTVIPDILANAGGVTVSYFEWVQDIQAYFWSEKEINARLQEIIVKAFRDVYETAQREKVDMRLAAFMVGLTRLAKAVRIRGTFP